MPQPKYPTQVLVLVFILGALVHSLISNSFAPVIKLALNSYHMIALSPFGNPSMTEVQQTILFAILDLALITVVLLGAIIFQRKTNWKIT